MSLPKPTCTCRLKPETRKRLDDLAIEQHRSLGNLMEILLENSLERLQKAGSIERLLRRREQSKEAK